jgi:hypothetical protein
MVITLKEAAECTGKTKVALLKAIQKGRFSASKNEKGEWEIVPAELFRVYHPIDNRFTTGSPNITTDSPPEIHFLRESLKREQAERERERATLQGLLDDLRRDKMFLQEQLRTTSLLLEHKKSADTTIGSPRKPVEAPVGFFGMFSRRKT